MVCELLMMKKQSASARWRVMQCGTFKQYWYLCWDQAVMETVSAANFTQNFSWFNQCRWKVAGRTQLLETVQVKNVIMPVLRVQLFFPKRARVGDGVCRHIINWESMVDWALQKWLEPPQFSCWVWDAPSGVLWALRVVSWTPRYSHHWHGVCT